MKRLFCIIGFAIVSIIVMAQNDSLAIANMTETGIYCIKNDTLFKMTPITSDGIVTKGKMFSVKSSLVYDGENSEYIMDDKPIFYIFIESQYRKMINPNQFRLTTLTVTDGTRQIKTVSNSVFSGKIGVEYVAINSQQIAEGCYKLWLDDSLEVGHYGLFYNYGGGVPNKLYDFDVIENQ